MKDPKVTELVKQLKTLVKDINKVNTKLYQQGVTYRLEESYDEENHTKQIEVRYLKQEVKYD